MVVGLHTLIGEVANMERSVAYYRDLVGFKVQFTSPDWSTLTAGNMRLGLHPPFDRESEVRGGGWVCCLEVSDIAEFRAKLENAHVACTDYHDTPGGAIFDFSDPDGNRLQAMQPGIKRKQLVS